MWAKALAVAEELGSRIDALALAAKGLKVLVILLAIWVALLVLRAVLSRLEGRLLERAEALGTTPGESRKRAETLVGLMRQAIRIVIWTVGGLTALSELGVDIGPILASAGILGLAVGFGAQNLVRDFISGFFMVLEDQVRVGDVAVVNGIGGLVEQVRLRTLVLRDQAGVVHVFPNGAVTTLANMTKEWSGYLLEIGVAYKEDTDRVVAVMKEVGEQLRADAYYGPMVIADLEVFGVDKLADSAVVIKGRIKTHPMKQWEVGREYLRRIKQAFDREGIEIPFPHLSLYFGEASKPVLANVHAVGTKAGSSPSQDAA